MPTKKLMLKKKTLTKPLKGKKKTLKKVLSRKTIKKKPERVSRKKGAKLIIGKFTHYFPQVKAGVLKLKAPLKAGDTIRIKGHTTDFTETVISMQINHLPIEEAKKGQEIGLSVSSRVRRGDIVYKI